MVVLVAKGLYVGVFEGLGEEVEVLEGMAEGKGVKVLEGVAEGGTGEGVLEGMSEGVGDGVLVAVGEGPAVLVGVGGVIGSPTALVREELKSTSPLRELSV